MSSRIRFIGGGGNAGGLSGKRRTSSFKKSLVAICRCIGYPQFLTRVSRSCDRGTNRCGVSIRCHLDSLARSLAIAGDAHSALA